MDDKHKPVIMRAVNEKTGRTDRHVIWAPPGSTPAQIAEWETEPRRQYMRGVPEFMRRLPGEE